MSSMTKAIYFPVLMTIFCGMTVASDIDPVKLIGIWKLEQSGFIEDGAKVIKDFTPCRLSRNFIFKSDGTVDYTYYEGDLDTCYVTEVESYRWRLEKDTLMVESNGYFGYYLLAMRGEDELSMQMIDKNKVLTGDELTDKILNAVHFDVYRRQSKPVHCDQCKLVLKLK